LKEEEEEEEDWLFNITIISGYGKTRSVEAPKP